MSPVIYNDVLAAVSVVAGHPPECRATVATALIREADLADAYRQAQGAAHPVFGDGSLVTAALRHGRRGAVSFQCPCGLAAWIAVLEALAARAARRSDQDRICACGGPCGHSIP